MGGLLRGQSCLYKGKEGDFFGLEIPNVATAWTDSDKHCR